MESEEIDDFLDFDSTKYIRESVSWNVCKILDSKSEVEKLLE